MELENISHRSREVRKIIDSKAPAGMGYDMLVPGINFNTDSKIIESYMMCDNQLQIQRQYLETNHFFWVNQP